MIEQFSDDELKIIIKEIEQRKHENQLGTRSQIIKREAEALGMGDMFMSTEMRDCFVKLLDYLTENYTRQTNMSGKPRDVRNKIVPEKLRDKYAELARELLKAMMPYYGMLGFRPRR